MSARVTFRIAGIALIAGAVLSFLTSLLTSLLFSGNDPTPYAGNPLFVPVNLLSVLGTALLLFGLPLLYVSRPEGWGVLGLVGFALLFATGVMFGVFFSLFSALFVPYLVQHAPSVVKGTDGPPGLFPFFILGTIFEVIAAVLIAVPMIRGLVANRSIGYVLIAAAVLAVVGFFVGGGNSPNPLLALVGNLSSLLLFIALGWLGYLLWMGHAGFWGRLVDR
ncbi:MAG: hypothetical protein DLM67_19535 [Candidatus Nephthysia bennettiae]|uniref:Uncharacterized protein n=1 Tax=Candidatus Nephthysia bennettiae TaxID=3127016 RepID=A0A934N209_9BACT|nr:hypothetical protein [Candidatus Dormibacteraeota bacterium]MBJ7611838.1 hypothetical protein [Candidatus Dormibacteraeota bacterium]PZR88950.1 MAG: hypothetical protein DLM67_19535 [Candidatus Dormibacteraeota bacterium]